VLEARFPTATAPCVIIGRAVTRFPAIAAWRHVDARTGFEVLFARRDPDDLVFEGHVTAVEDGEAWSVRYTLALEPSWRTRTARIAVRSATGEHEAHLEADGHGAWRVDGAPTPHLDGCMDVDLEASAFTNALPVHRLDLAIGAQAEAPAAWVRVPDARVERLDQSYSHLDATRYAYEAPDLEFQAELVYDEHGLILDYPGIAVRVA
jgi:uncharacterized protein